MAAYLSQDFVDENFRSMEQYLVVPNRTCSLDGKEFLNTVDREIGFSLGKLYCQGVISRRKQKREPRRWFTILKTRFRRKD